MKEKYKILEAMGWSYEGKTYLQGDTVELSKGEFEALDGKVKLEKVTNDEPVEDENS